MFLSILVVESTSLGKAVVIAVIMNAVTQVTTVRKALRCSVVEVCIYRKTSNTSRVSNRSRVSNTSRRL